MISDPSGPSLPNASSLSVTLFTSLASGEILLHNLATSSKLSKLLVTNSRYSGVGMFSFSRIK